jgi:phosphatidylethanolamine/phosphatidyl-N-methylethanolamine N-methyltransferase
MTKKATADTEESLERSRTAQGRYNRVSRFYDLTEAVNELLLSRRLRSKQWAKVKGERVLEVGIGTGKNIPHHTEGSRVCAVDISSGMLRGAQKRARKRGAEVDLILADAERLPFHDNVFDTSVSTFVFCSVPDPVHGLGEVQRVTRPGGQVVLLEHVRARNRAIGKAMDWLNPLFVRLTGANINRDTVGNVSAAGLKTESVETYGLGMIKLIEAKA